MILRLRAAPPAAWPLSTRDLKAPPGPAATVTERGPPVALALTPGKGGSVGRVAAPAECQSAARKVV
jgi:hypothetical protein